MLLASNWSTIAFSLFPQFRCLLQFDIPIKMVIKFYRLLILVIKMACFLLLKWLGQNHKMDLIVLDLLFYYIQFGAFLKFLGFSKNFKDFFARYLNFIF